MCVAAPARVLRIESKDGISIPAVASFAGGVERDVDLAMVPDAQVGDYVVVHSGFAIRIVTNAEAAESLRLFRQSEGREA